MARFARRTEADLPGLIRVERPEPPAPLDIAGDELLKSPS